MPMGAAPIESKSNDRAFCLYNPARHDEIVERLKVPPIKTFEQFATEFNATQARENDDETRQSMVLRVLHTHVSREKRAKYAYNAYLQFCWSTEFDARHVKIDPRSRAGAGDKKRSRVQDAFEHDVGAPSVRTVSERLPTQHTSLVRAAATLGIFAPPPPPPPRALAFLADVASVVSVDESDWDLPAPETSKPVAAGHSRGVPTWQVERPADVEDEEASFDFSSAVIIECTDGVIFATQEERASFAALGKSTENVTAPFSMSEMDLALGRGISLDRVARAVAFLKRSG